MRWIVTILIFSILQWYAFQGIKTITANRWIWMVYGVVVIVIVGNLLLHSLILERPDNMEPKLMYAIGLFITLFTFQALITLVLMAEDIIRVPQSIYAYFFKMPGQSNFFPERRKFLSQLAIGLAAIPFTSLLYGMYRGRYNYKVLSYVLEYDDLPDAFDGFKITQISDIHSGSFDNPKKVKYGVDLINKQQSDIVLFTGDLVNNKSEEVLPWTSVFGEIKAPQGVYSILGNHDYGDYTQWDSKEAKDQNMKDLYAAQKKMGWDLLLNESRFIEKDGQRIAIVGVENWGTGRFKKAGDLNKALENVAAEDFKILMSHDPSHWEAEVLPHPYNVHLTLSGHTHGMQFGIDIPGWIKWSPIKWRYPEFAGLYKKTKEYLYVNRGFGYLAYPGRVGMWPEITVMTLKKRKIDV
jgi:predicted MPP superfamily phosphohydrolase